MLVPAAVIELDEAHVALGEPAGQQAVGGVGAGLARLRAVQLEHRVRLLRQIHQLRARTSACGRPSRTARCASRSPDRRTPRASSAFSFATASSICAARRRVDARRIVEVQHRRRCRRGSARPDSCDGRKPLPHSRENSGWSALIAVRLRQQHDERRQVLVLAAQAVAEPGAHARPARLLDPVWMNVIAGSWLIASVFIVLMTVMSSTIFAVCGSSSLTQVPDWPCCANSNIELRHRQRRLPHRLRDALAHAHRVGHLRAVELREPRLVVERLELRRPARLVQEDHALGLRREVRQRRSGRRSSGRAPALRRRRHRAARGRAATRAPRRRCPRAVSPNSCRRVR